MRVLLDTNTLLSAFLWGGLPRQLLVQLRQVGAEFLISDALVSELRRVLSRPKFEKRFIEAGLTVDGVIDDYLDHVRLVYPTEEISADVVRDPKDGMVLACAVSEQANFIVTGDNDLLVLIEFRGVKIVTVRELLSALEEIEKRNHSDE